jgi:hypothetical protein
MHWTGVFFELVGAFLLAAEAIKTKNLVLLGQKMKGIASKLRRFQRMDEFSFRMLGNVIGIVVLFAMFLFGISASTPALIATQTASGLSLIILVLFLERIARSLEWVERNTANGMVGITGFVSYVISVIIREVIS